MYALKVVRSDMANEVSVRRSFRAEAKVWICLGDHPNVTKACYFEEVERELYITMAYVEAMDDAAGSSLSDTVAAGPR